MKLRTSSLRPLTALGLALALASCGAIEGERHLTVASPLPALHPRSLPVRVQEAGAQNRVEWFRSGPYVGGALGWGFSTADDGDIDSDLADRGYTTSTSLDESDLGWKLYGGYRFERPFAVELAAVDLGTIESDIDVSTSDIDAFLDDVTDVHPFSAKGASLTGTWYALDEADLQLGLKGGLWWWDGEVEARAATGERASDSDTGVDVVFGGVGQLDVSEQWALRAELEHYRLDDEGVTLVSIGAQWSPGPTTQRPRPRQGDSTLPPALLR